MLHMAFPHNYEAELLQEFPGFPSAGTAQRFYFPGGVEAGGRDGLIVRVVPELGNAWVGIFAFGKESRRGVSGLYTCPQSDWICVVASGQGYWVNVHDPTDTELVPLTPILGVLPVPSEGLLAFYDFTRLIALGVGGVAWKTPSLSWDGLEEVRAIGGVICGKAWDSPREQWVAFEVELDSGSYCGGSSPELLHQGR